MERTSGFAGIRVCWHHEHLDDSALAVLRTLQRRFKSGQVSHVQLLERLAWLSSALPGHPVEVVLCDSSGLTLYGVGTTGVVAPVHFAGADFDSVAEALGTDPSGEADRERLFATLHDAGPLPVREKRTRPLHRERVTLLLPLPLGDILKRSHSPSEVVARAWHEAKESLSAIESGDDLLDIIPEPWRAAGEIQLVLGLSPGARMRLDEETQRLGVEAGEFISAVCFLGRRALPS